ARAGAMAHVTAPRLYKSPSDADYAIVPAPALTVPSGGDYEELRLRVTAVDDSARPFTITARIARTLVAPSGWKPLDFLLRAGTLVAAWLIEQRAFADTAPLFHTGNSDKTAGTETALGRLRAGLFAQEAGRRPIGCVTDLDNAPGGRVTDHWSVFSL